MCVFISWFIHAGITQAEGLAQKLHAVMVFAAVSESGLFICEGFGGVFFARLVLGVYVGFSTIAVCFQRC